MKKFTTYLVYVLCLFILFSGNSLFAQEKNLKTDSALWQKQLHVNKSNPILNDCDYTGANLTTKEAFASSSLTKIGQLNTGESCYAITVSGNYVYFLSGFYLEIIDVKDPTNPELLGKVFMQGSDNLCNVTVSGNYAYVSDVSNGVYIVDVSDPTVPVIVKKIPPVGSVSGHGVEIVHDTAYMTFGYYGLHIYNVKDPVNPQRIGAFDTTSYETFDVKLYSRYAYLAQNSNGLRVVDISDPSKPIEVGSYKVDLGSSNPEDCYSILINGQYGYILDQNYGIDILDLSNPTAPVRAKFINNLGPADNISISENYLYIANYAGPFRMFDISNPANPTEISIPQMLLDHAASQGSYIYAMSGPKLDIFRNDLLTGVENHKASLNEDINLAQNYPNPVNSLTTINFSILKPGFVTLKVFDLEGQQIATLVNKMKSPGDYKVKFNAVNLPEGIYIYSLEENGQTITKEMTIK